jgi:hypothetical protein
MERFWSARAECQADQARRCGLADRRTVPVHLRYGRRLDHQIAVEAIKEDPSGEIRCLEGQRSCPPEDCSGPYGYQELLEKLFDPSHPEHEEMKEWAGEFAPEDFSLDAVNRRLARLNVSRQRAS